MPFTTRRSFSFAKFFAHLTEAETEADCPVMLPRCPVMLQRSEVRVKFVEAIRQVDDAFFTNGRGSSAQGSEPGLPRDGCPSGPPAEDDAPKKGTRRQRRSRRTSAGVKSGTRAATGRTRQRNDDSDADDSSDDGVAFVRHDIPKSEPSPELPEPIVPSKRQRGESERESHDADQPRGTPQGPVDTAPEVGVSARKRKWSASESSERTLPGDSGGPRSNRAVGEGWSTSKAHRATEPTAPASDVPGHASTAALQSLAACRAILEKLGVSQETVLANYKDPDWVSACHDDAVSLSLSGSPGNPPPADLGSASLPLALRTCRGKRGYTAKTGSACARPSKSCCVSKGCIERSDDAQALSVRLPSGRYQARSSRSTLDC